VYGNIIHYFGRGMALANQSRFAEAKEALNRMREFMKDSSLQIPLTPFSPVIEGAITAENLLIGTIALKENRIADAITAFNKAVVTEENMVYTEPRDWMLNPKHFLGNAYLQKKDGVNAEKVFRKDLLNNNENGWALYGLYKSLVMQKKTTEAAKVMTRHKLAFIKADIKISSPVY
jgi:tetratricopeptide (TPR) repeat protein